MAIEIERKFIARAEALPIPQLSTKLQQGYINRDQATVRIRISGEKCFLTIKGATSGMSRLEFEYPIPMEDGLALLKQLCRQPLIEKTRHLIDHAEHRWEVDIFEGENAGLVVAEVELDDEDEIVQLPDWVEREVTHDPKYANAALAKQPYSQWNPEEKAE